jgi:hypothetical protein
VAERGVDRHAVQLHPALREVVDQLLVDRELVRADRAEVERVEDQHRGLALQVGERDRLAILIPELEVRRRAAGLDHRRRPSSRIRLR